MFAVVYPLSSSPTSWKIFLYSYLGFNIPIVRLLTSICISINLVLGRSLSNVSVLLL